MSMCIIPGVRGHPAFNSVRVGVAGFCLLKLGTVLRHDQRILLKLFGFEVKLQLEAVRQERLKRPLLTSLL